MHLDLIDSLKHSEGALSTQKLIESCVHCGMCLGTCPTFGITGDEADSPRGRIYQVKNLLEGQADAGAVQLHLDRCLTCRSCETTCPSSVNYGEILEWGREHLSEHHARLFMQRMQLKVLRAVLTRPKLFGALWRVGAIGAAVLPKQYARKLSYRTPFKQPSSSPIKTLPSIDLTVLIHQGCVQNTLSPNINQASERLLHAWGVRVLHVQDHCCGAVSAHSDDLSGARAFAKRNIQAWQTVLEEQPKALIISNASGCGVQLKQYGSLFKTNDALHASAQQVSAAVRDIAQIFETICQLQTPLVPEMQHRIGQLNPAQKRMSYHESCTLQHGQKLKGMVPKLLRELGLELSPSINTHLCCGSAGTYSITQAKLSQQLLENKIKDLKCEGSAGILSANVGCIHHIASGTEIPVMHWIEWLDAVWTNRI